MKRKTNFFNPYPEFISYFRALMKHPTLKRAIDSVQVILKDEIDLNLLKKLTDNKVKNLLNENMIFKSNEFDECYVEAGYTQFVQNDLFLEFSCDPQNKYNFNTIHYCYGRKIFIHFIFNFVDNSVLCICTKRSNSRSPFNDKIIQEFSKNNWRIYRAFEASPDGKNSENSFNFAHFK